jgi:hypothetical protein
LSQCGNPVTSWAEEIGKKEPEVRESKRKYDISILRMSVVCGKAPTAPAAQDRSTAQNPAGLVSNLSHHNYFR